MSDLRPPDRPHVSGAEVLVLAIICWGLVGVVMWALNQAAEFVGRFWR